MSKHKNGSDHKKNGQKHDHDAELAVAAAPIAAAEPQGPLSRKEFEKELEPLQVELVKLQEWVKATGAKVCVIFEGRDAAGKGGIIKRLTERTSPRVFRVVALPSPTEREKSQMYFQRYMPHLPAAGEVVLFDRSWYNRAGVERVMGFATPEQVDSFLKFTPMVERAIIASGVTLVKYWLEVSQENQTKRFRSALTITARFGNLAQWTSKVTGAGMTIHAPVTPCLRQRILLKARGMLSTPMTNGEAASTASHTS